MNIRIASMLARLGAILFAATALGRPAVPPRAVPAEPIVEYVLRGEVRVLSVSPWNPAGRDRLGTRIVVRVERGAARGPVVILTHAGSGQSCRFEAREVGRTMLAFQPRQTCRFTALGSGGSLQMSNGWLEEREGRMRLRGLVDATWLNYRGTMTLAVEGSRTR